MSSRRRPPRNAAEVADRSGTNPICPDCEYRTVAIDDHRTACRHCGQILEVDVRAARIVARRFPGSTMTKES